MSLSGPCESGDFCRHAHGVHELRARNRNTFTKQSFAPQGQKRIYNENQFAKTAAHPVDRSQKYHSNGENHSDQTALQYEGKRTDYCGLLNSIELSELPPPTTPWNSEITDYSNSKINRFFHDRSQRRTDLYVNQLPVQNRTVYQSNRNAPALLSSPNNNSRISTDYSCRSATISPPSSDNSYTINHPSYNRLVPDTWQNDSKKLQALPSFGSGKLFDDPTIPEPIEGHPKEEADSHTFGGNNVVNHKVGDDPELLMTRRMGARSCSLHVAEFPALMKSSDRRASASNPQSKKLTHQSSIAKRRQSVLCIDLSETKPAAADAYPLAALVGRHLESRISPYHDRRRGNESDSQQYRCQPGTLARRETRLHQQRELEHDILTTLQKQPFGGSRTYCDQSPKSGCRAYESTYGTSNISLLSSPGPSLESLYQSYGKHYYTRAFHRNCNEQQSFGPIDDGPTLQPVVDQYPTYDHYHLTDHRNSFDYRPHMLPMEIYQTPGRSLLDQQVSVAMDSAAMEEHYISRIIYPGLPVSMVSGLTVQGHPVAQEEEYIVQENFTASSEVSCAYAYKF